MIFGDPSRSPARLEISAQLLLDTSALVVRDVVCVGTCNHRSLALLVPRFSDRITDRSSSTTNTIPSAHAKGMPQLEDPQSVASFASAFGPQHYQEVASEKPESRTSQV
jgi:hypothetical protein